MIQPKQSANFLLAVGLVLLVTAPLRAGVVYEIEVKDHEQSPPKTESIQAVVEGRDLKMGVASRDKGAQGEMIFHGDRREMVVVDHENKSFHVMDENMIRQLASQVNDAMSQMDEMLKNVPADKRAMVEKMMRQKMPQQAPKSPATLNELVNTGERAKKEGYPCVKYELVRDGRKVRELWVTDWGNIKGGSDVVDVYEDMADFFADMTAAMPRMGQDGSGVSDNVFEHMKELRGFIVLDREFNRDGSLASESTLRDARRQKLDPDAFEPPSGYKRQEMLR